MTITTATLAGVDSTTIADLIITSVRRQATPTVRDVYMDVPGRPGAWHFGEAGGDRDLTLGLLVASASFADRRSTVRAVGRWLWPNVDEDGERELYLSDEPDRYELVTLADTVDLDELLDTGQGSATFRAAPYALDALEDTAVLNLTAGAPTDTVDVAAGVDLANELPIVIEVTPANDMPAGFTLTVRDTVALTYSGAVLTGQTVTVNTETLTVDLDGTAALTATAGAFPKLVAGPNLVELDAGGAGATVTLTWRRRYV